MANSMVQFAPFSTTISPSFWSALAAHKIDRLQLSDDVVRVRGHYATGRKVLDRQTGEQLDMPASMSVEGDALADNYSTPSNSFATWGVLKNFNTIEEFKNADKQAIFNAVAEQIYTGLLESDDPTPFLSKFLVLSFADLKKYKFVYWFGFPALVSQPAWQLATSTAWQNAATQLGLQQMTSIASLIAKRRQAQADDSASASFFLVRTDQQQQVELANVTQWSSFFQGIDEDKRIVGFIDPSPREAAPGWPLRNLLALLSLRYGVRNVQVLCWKDEHGFTFAEGEKGKSTLAQLVMPESTGQDGFVKGAKGDVPLKALSNDASKPSAVGWERNAQGKLAPKVADLGPLMDPKRLADQAVDLNLKLMRWRIMPDINLERVQNTKCLLLGAGTLGCYVARTLMGWGVRHITLVDSSTVSFSNPVRQPLFDFDDCLNGGKPKAQCAADKLRQIYPGVQARGVQMNIPMPGHPIAPGQEAQVEKDVKDLVKLIEEHDVVYLLMDSRESRWLPTMLGAAQNKIVLNAALGFDTYLVMRHGAAPDAASDKEAEANKPPHQRRLGCYFCNDIVAPADSLTDRTLDQMCTVTRPGLAAIAGASAVELMVSVLQHKDGVRAPASTGPTRAGAVPEDSSDPAKSGSVLGLIPHQIRGFLAQFSNMLIVGQAYDRCTACSAAIVQEYQTRGFEMLKEAFNDDAYLERATGLDKMKAETEALEADLELDWSEEEGEGELL